jgi:hypothetical protein
MWRTVLENSNFAAGCGVVAVTVAAEAPALLEKAAEVFRSNRSILTKLLTDGGVPAKRAVPLGVSLTFDRREIEFVAYSAASPFASIIKTSRLSISCMARPAMPWRSP